MVLSEDRADSVVNFLTSAGIEANRMVAKGVGPFVPISTNETKEGTRLNRRVEIVKRLKFDVQYDQVNELWKVTVPSLRSDDIVQEIDLIEEIGRLYGFDNFLTRIPPIKNLGQKDLSYQTRKKLTNCFIVY